MLYLQLRVCKMYIETPIVNTSRNNINRKALANPICDSSSPESAQPIIIEAAIIDFDTSFFFSRLMYNDIPKPYAVCSKNTQRHTIIRLSGRKLLNKE